MVVPQPFGKRRDSFYSCAALTHCNVLLLLSHVFHVCPTTLAETRAQLSLAGEPVSEPLRWRRHLSLMPVAVARGLRGLDFEHISEAVVAWTNAQVQRAFQEAQMHTSSLQEALLQVWAKVTTDRQSS